MGFDLNENLKRLPAKPGVYLHKDSFGEVIYVGKATSLRSRVRQYFTSPENMDAKTQALTRYISEFEYIVTDTEAEALILENTLIKKYRPRFNVMLLDDKTYPYLKITYGEEYPRLIKTRILTSDDGSKYFGPYADVGALNHIIELLNDSYKLKRCSRRSFPKDWRHCLNGFIGVCDSYCTPGSPSPKEYAERIKGVTGFLKGQDRSLVSSLKARMKEASDMMDFEAAAKCRDLIFSAEVVTERQKVDLLSSGSIDICLASETDTEVGRGARVTLFFVRDGRLTGREIHHLDADEGSSKKEIITAFLKQYYANQTMLPKEILLEEGIEDKQTIEDWLSESAGHRVKLLVPERGDKSALLKLAKKDVNETEALAGDIISARKERDTAAEEELRSIAGLKTNEDDAFRQPPLRIEAYDISHTGGEDSVGAMVVFVGPKKNTKDYRRFKIRTVDDSGKSADDYASLQEVLYRRLKKGLEGESGFEILPDIVLVDGGSGHVASATKIAEALGVEERIPILGMVKDDRHRTRGLVFEDSEIDLSEKPELYRLIGTIQEEVHRFVVEYHRGKRSKKLIKSELDDIAGIGEKRKTALLLKYGGVGAIKSASIEDLEAVPGMNRKAAEAVFEYFASK